MLNFIFLSWRVLYGELHFAKWRSIKMLHFPKLSFEKWSIDINK